MGDDFGISTKPRGSAPQAEEPFCRKIGEINPDSVLNWVRSLPYTPELCGEQKTGRLTRWFGFRVQQFGGKPAAFEAEPMPEWLDDLRLKFHPCANSAQAYFYQPKADHPEHRDLEVFGDRTVMINILDTIPTLFGETDPAILKWGGNRYELRHGEVWEFQNKMRHEIKPVPCVRFSIQFRELKLRPRESA